MLVQIKEKGFAGYHTGNARNKNGNGNELQNFKDKLDQTERGRARDLLLSLAHTLTQYTVTHIQVLLTFGSSAHTPPVSVWFKITLTSVSTLTHSLSLATFVRENTEFTPAAGL